MSLSYPDRPSDEQKKRMFGLIKSFSIIYPCKTCRIDFQGTMRDEPPQLESKEQFAMWLCHQHNMVNVKLGKPEFKCSIRRLELVYGRESLRQKFMVPSMRT